MRIEGITIKDDLRIEYGLTAIYGVGISLSRKILEEANVDFSKKPSDLKESEEKSIREAIEKQTIEGELRRKTASDIKRLKDIKSYRGTRHMKNLPARGQRTRANSRTVRGNVRKTMGSGKRKVEKK